MGNINESLSAIITPVKSYKMPLKRYKSLLNATAEAICTFSKDGKITEINKQAIEILGGKSSSEFIQKSYKNFIEKEQPHLDLSVEIYLNQLIDSLVVDPQKSTGFDLLALRIDGNNQWVHCNVSPIFLSKGTILQVIIKSTFPRTKSRNLEQKKENENENEKEKIIRKNSDLKSFEINSKKENSYQDEKDEKLELKEKIMINKLKLKNLKQKKKEVKKAKKDTWKKEKNMKRKRIQELIKSIQFSQTVFEKVEQNLQQKEKETQKISQLEDLSKTNANEIEKLIQKISEIKSKNQKKISLLKKNLKKELEEKEKELIKSENEIHRLSNRIKLVEEQKENLSLLI
ncbi:cilia and flagella-associated protein [Anaeramoeba ignava]|uniref:Cilia and flagella-associated protein n=1 Tax=Anaeramoeba ignava TaxID=1746090 RepID=A0A9Q0L863_ANAIG|nr:cilia and flagella-associated protein [Anaeramoeba ignava]